MVGGVSGAVPGVRLLRARQQLPADADVSRTRYSWQSIVPPKSVASWHVHSECSELPITSHTPSPRARTAASAAGVAVEATLLVTLPANELSGFRQTEPAWVVLQVVPAGQEMS